MCKEKALVDHCVREVDRREMDSLGGGKKQKFFFFQGFLGAYTGIGLCREIQTPIIQI